MVKQDKTGRVNAEWKRFVPPNFPDGTCTQRAGFVTTGHGTSFSGCGAFEWQVFSH
jgi:hypothetical protein